MSKRELIDAIRTHNRTVSPAFLARFAEVDLKAYLERICLIRPAIQSPRINTAIHANQLVSVA